MPNTARRWSAMKKDERLEFKKHVRAAAEEKRGAAVQRRVRTRRLPQQSSHPLIWFGIQLKPDS